MPQRAKRIRLTANRVHLMRWTNLADTLLVAWNNLRKLPTSEECLHDFRVKLALLTNQSQATKNLLSQRRDAGQETLEDETNAKT